VPGDEYVDGLCRSWERALRQAACDAEALAFDVAIRNGPDWNAIGDHPNPTLTADLTDRYRQSRDREQTAWLEYQAAAAEP